MNEVAPRHNFFFSAAASSHPHSGHESAAPQNDHMGTDRADAAMACVEDSACMQIVFLPFTPHDTIHASSVMPRPFTVAFFYAICTTVAHFTASHGPLPTPQEPAVPHTRLLVVYVAGRDTVSTSRVRGVRHAWRSMKVCQLSPPDDARH